MRACFACTQEAVQVLRYQPGQYYGAHLDYTNRLNYGQNLQKMQHMKGTYENRMATVFWCGLCTCFAAYSHACFRRTTSV
jgi:hypothetical protein